MGVPQNSSHFSNNAGAQCTALHFSMHCRQLANSKSGSMAVCLGLLQDSKWKTEVPDVLDHAETILTVSTWSNKCNKLFDIKLLTVNCDHTS